MAIITILLTLLGAPDSDSPPPPDTWEKTFFCCHEVDPKTESGEGCVTIAESQINACGEVLACPDGFTKHDGVVKCSDS